MHVLGTAYGWTKQDVAALTWREIDFFVTRIKEDTKRQREAMNRHRSRRR